MNSATDSKQASENRARPPTAPIVEFLLKHAPFDHMLAEHVEWLAEHVTLGFYAKDEAIVEPGGAVAETFYIIKQGRVRGESPRHRAEAWELVVGECFPIGALIAHRATTTRHRAVDDTFCFELSREDFETLLEKSVVFKGFCTSRLATLLAHAVRTMQADLATEVTGDSALNTPLKALVRRPPVTCLPSTTIHAALDAMNRERIGSIVVADDKRHPLGVFTLHDLLSRVIVAGLDLGTPIERVMSREPQALPPSAFAHEAAMVMASRGIGHLCVVDDGRLVGVVSERDLFSLQRVGLVNLSRSIKHAPDLESLIRLGRDVHRLVAQMLAQGASVHQLTQIITLLNDHITRRVIELSLAEHGAPPVEFTWLAFGSEGRLEQTLKTDQDNGIVFSVPAGQTAEQVREQLLPLARVINEALDACGYPLCVGKIMASNPECCLSESEWESRFARWIDQGSPEDLLKASIYFDLRVLYGADDKAKRLRAAVLRRTASTSRFLRMLAESALRNQPPLGLVRDFLVETEGEHAHAIDLKRRGTMPFVDGARLFALAHGIEETNTNARLRALAKAGIVSASEVDAWCDAYDFIQLLRLRRHRAQDAKGEPLDNYVNPDELNDLDRRILKEAFRQARKVQSRMALDYQL
ncbi:MAG: CBS domain-containing protein [Pseudomonadota bacterium]|nr:MAG: CBS domain-containing protein [Pseudomonadota bacterium]